MAWMPIHSVASAESSSATSTQTAIRRGGCFSARWPRKRIASGRITASMKRDEQDREDHGQHRAAQLRLRDADDERQQAPGGHVVGRRAAQGDDAELGVLDAAGR